MTDEKKKQNENEKNNPEIQVENKDLLNVFFSKSNSQFESQFYLSRKRALNAENGQSELSDLLKSKLKALDMMLLILSNNKNILKEADLSCCEVLNNLLSISKKDKVYGELIFSKIKNILVFLIKNQILIEEKNIEAQKICIRFLINILNIKFDNGYFKQVLDIISQDKNIFEIFLDEFLIKIFKGRNIIIKIKEMKFIIKSILLNEKIINNKYITYFDLMEKIINYAKEKNSGGCRTSFQLNQVVFLLQYMTEISNINEVKKNLDSKKIENILELFKNAINDMINKNDYEFDINQMNKKNLEIKNDIIKRKKLFFGEMFNFLNKLKKYFDDVFNKNKEGFQNILDEINNLYKNIINKRYIIIVNSNNNNKDTKDNINKNKKNKEKKENSDIKEKPQSIKEYKNKDNEEENKDNDKNIELEEKKKDEDKEEKNDKNEEQGIELNEEDEEHENKSKNKKDNKDKKGKKDKKKENKQDNKTENNKKNKKAEKKEENKIKKKKKIKDDNNAELKNKKTNRKESKDKEEEKKENKNKKKKKY